MVALPAGTFVMGSPKGEGYDDERPQRSIRLDAPLAVGKFEVTWEEYNLCRYDGPCDAAPEDGFGGGRRPVTNVSFNDATTYADWLSARTGHRYRLLSEAEWEYAARAGSTTSYPWGPRILPGKANCDGCGGNWNGNATAPVGTFAANAFGLHDMQGNVWEWVQDCFAVSYGAGHPRNGSAFQPKGCVTRIIRGGSWNTTPSRLRSANRLQSEPLDRVREIGFRVARH
jgi:formylglycine-generating enzyme required for sulfatase activity